jgi:hypothetical protein
MKSSSIKNLRLFKIIDEISQNTYYGNDQEWYESKWQRLSGCGPTTVANIIYYFNKTNPNIILNNFNPTKKDSLLLMDEIWKYVTPSMGGVSSTGMLCKGVLKYIREKELNIGLDVIDIPKKRLLRPEFQKLIEFLAAALDKDMPVAFLNLHNGKVKELDSWHWVTIISLEYDESQAHADILDEGMIKKIDLAEWFNTTAIGGGFVSFNRL